MSSDILHSKLEQTRNTIAAAVAIEFFEQFVNLKSYLTAVAADSHFRLSSIGTLMMLLF
jgi:hypothetical protein